VRGEGRGEGRFRQAQNRGSAPSPGLRRNPTSPRAAAEMVISVKVGHSAELLRDIGGHSPWHLDRAAVIHRNKSLTIAACRGATRPVVSSTGAAQAGNRERREGEIGSQRAVGWQFVII
jgi:hypothetical protein